MVRHVAMDGTRAVRYEKPILSRTAEFSLCIEWKPNVWFPRVGACVPAIIFMNVLTLIFNLNFTPTNIQRNSVHFVHCFSSFFPVDLAQWRKFRPRKPIENGKEFCFSVLPFFFNLPVRSFIICVIHCAPVLATATYLLSFVGIFFSKSEHKHNFPTNFTNSFGQSAQWRPAG